MLVKRLVLGMMETNCYIAGDEDTKEVFIIDPGGDLKKIKAAIKKDGLKPKAIINTHGHGDHIALDGKFDLPIWIHEDDKEFLTDPSKNLSLMLGSFLKIGNPAQFLKEGDILNIGKYKLEVLHTPGHTPGSISLKGEGIVFTGDTLFAGGIGRTDFSYGSEDDIIASIKEKLLMLDDRFLVYPGHGPSTTIGAERPNF